MLCAMGKPKVNKKKLATDAAPAADVDVDEPEHEVNLEEDFANIMEQHHAPDDS